MLLLRSASNVAHSLCSLGKERPCSLGCICTLLSSHSLHGSSLPRAREAQEQKELKSCFNMDISGGKIIKSCVHETLSLLLSVPSVWVPSSFLPSFPPFLPPLLLPDLRQNPGTHRYHASVLPRNYIPDPQVEMASNG